MAFLPTQTGNLFVLNRLTGQPVYPITQVDVSTRDGVQGEKFSPISPVSARNFIPDPIDEKSMWGLTPFDQLACRIDYKSLRYDGNPWTSATETGSIPQAIWYSMALPAPKQTMP